MKIYKTELLSDAMIARKTGMVGLLRGKMETAQIVKGPLFKMAYQKPKIVVSEKTKANLDEIGTRKDTYDSIIQMLLKVFHSKKS